MKRKDNAVDKAIGARVRARREALGLSQKAVGALIDVTYQQIQKFESGRDHLKVEQLKKLAAGLDTTQSYLMNGTDAAGFADAGAFFVGADAATIAQAHDLTRLFLSLRSQATRDAVIELTRRLADAEQSGSTVRSL